MDTTLNSISDVLGGAGVSALDCARFIRNILDSKPVASNLTDAQFIANVISTGLRNVRSKEMSVAEGFAIYYQSKQHLRHDSIRDIRCIGNRLLRMNPELGICNFSAITVSECEQYIIKAFTTPSLFNKARAMLHALFEFAIRRDWCECNPVKKIERRKVIEKEILPLKLADVKRLIKNARKEGTQFAVTAAILIYTGIRPREVRHLTWRDIDTDENVITVRSQCSKTGGVRQVEIPPALHRLLLASCPESAEERICPSGWVRRWRRIRDTSGFRKAWVCDILRHTYASFHAKRYSDLPRLQLNMGHADLALLRSRYVNMHGIAGTEAKCFFNN